MEDESVCAWCRHAYDLVSGERGRKLTDEEYDAVESHGCCNECREAILHDLRSKVEEERRKN